MRGDGIGSLLTAAFNMIKPALPKIASTIGLSRLSAGVTHGINKALKKDTIIKFSILLPLIASSIIPALIPKKKGKGNNNIFFLQK